jgi:cobalt/nickel transport system permease protein
MNPKKVGVSDAINFAGEHVPDFGTISRYSENEQSFVHRSSPWTKLAFLAMLVLTVVVGQSIINLLLTYVLVLSVYCVAGLPKKKLARWYLLPSFFTLVIAIPFAFTEPGHLVFSLDLNLLSIRLTVEGLSLLIKLYVKSLTVVTFSFTFIMTTKYSQLSFVIQKLLPSPVNSVFLLSYRFSFVILERISATLRAVNSRGGNLVRGFLGKSSLYGGVIAASLVFSVEKAERVGKAMEARGFSGKLQCSSHPPNPSLTGIALIIGSACLVLFAYFGGFL